MAADKPEPLQAFFTKGVFRGTCPACMVSHDFNPAEFTTKTLAYTCTCGRRYTVYPIGLRASQRKAVNLPGILVGKPGKSLLRLPCVVHDLSVKGSGITLGLTSAEMADTMQLRLKLDDPRKTALLLPCRVCRRERVGDRLVLGLEFKSLDLDTEATLNRYLSQ